MSNHTDSLIGRSIAASIGEPWDFESAAGQNRLKGEITAFSDSNEPLQWCLCTVSAFGEAGNRVVTVGVVDRYSEDAGLSERLAQGKKVVANFIYDPSGKELTAEVLRAVLGSPRGSKPELAFLAGSVQLDGDK